MVTTGQDKTLSFCVLSTEHRLFSTAGLKECLPKSLSLGEWRAHSKMHFKAEIQINTTLWLQVLVHKTQLRNNLETVASRQIQRECSGPEEVPARDANSQGRPAKHKPWTQAAPPRPLAGTSCLSAHPPAHSGPEGVAGPTARVPNGTWAKAPGRSLRKQREPLSEQPGCTLSEGKESGSAVPPGQQWFRSLFIFWCTRPGPQVVWTREVAWSADREGVS